MFEHYQITTAVGIEISSRWLQHTNMASYSARDVQILHIHQPLSDIGSVRLVFQAVRENVRCRSPLFYDVALTTR
jgi:hypothetical protein